MAELFESYASDFAQLVDSVRDRIKADVSKLSADARRSALQHAEAEAEEANELLMQMEIEVKSFPQSVRERYTGKLRDLKSDYEKLQRDIKAQRQPSNSGSGLPVDSYTDGDLEADEAPSQRQRLLQGTSLLEQGTERLQASTRLALETEDIGANILQDLRGQREQIEHSRDTLHGANTHIDRSSRTLQRMIRRAKQQKIVTMAIVVVLVLLILLILYSKLF
ncbi:t-SNARE VTI1 [Malassezia japonica]|uniref:t-SNARE VTI1 n=1 Tax=Malassezia japonica TaxID=223818 RepID=A0AAF0F3A8_9BASI|nr:t-SNARE VTI1 [Malassezia japonica]WFD37478.1 t-SNARE VTI1 [Malassezia japonica]